MAWVQVEQSVLTHRKTLLLADLLGLLPVPDAVGYLVALWTWGLDNANADGVIKGATPGVIARAAQWKGEVQVFFDALREAGFLEETSAGISFHDWPDYAGRLMEKREANALRMKQKRDVQRTCDERATHDPSTDDARAGATVPNRTVPNLTIDTIPSTPSALRGKQTAKRQEYTPEFEEWWAVNPRKISKVSAFACYKTRLREGATPAFLLAAITNYRDLCRKEHRLPKHIMHPDTFLGPSVPFQDYLVPAADEVAATDDSDDRIAELTRMAEEMGVKS